MRKVISLCLCLACMATALAGCAKAPEAALTGGDENQMIFGLVENAEKVAQSLVSAAGDASSVESEEVKTALQRARDTFVLVSKEGENALFSPVSLEMALGLLSEGTTGGTRQQLNAYLGIDDYSQLAKSILERSDEMTVGQEEETEDGEEISYDGYQSALNIANSLWVNDRYTLKEKYLGVAAEKYAAEVQALDMKDGEYASKIINDWCDAKTKGLVPSIVDPDMFKSHLALVLCNSVYFESAWFDEFTTGVGKFTNADGTVTELDDMLYSTEDAYYETDNAKAFGKRYMNGAVFIGILPDDGVRIKDIDLDALIASKTWDYDVRVSMPKLNYEYTADELIEALKTLGVVDMFDPDLAKCDELVNESKDLYVSTIKQKCKIELDEKGTKAAAVTMLGVMDNAAFMEEPKYKDVHLDRPFYYMIMDEISGQVLFIGAVSSI